MRAQVGTSGFSYPAWRGAFYPRGLKAGDMLRHYASVLSTVELNNSFYRLPPATAFEAWAEQAPGDFSFAVKAPQRITHHKRLLDVGEAVREFHESASALGARLGPLLFQLPPHFRADQPRLEAFLRLLPEVRVAMEFRHSSWFVEETYARLREHGVALVGGDGGEEADPHDPPFVQTARFLYLRLRRLRYAEAALEAWAARLRGTAADEAFVYFKHETEGPAYAARLQHMLAPGPTAPAS